ncbi:low affinity iron permease family protein [Achromobacter sp. RTa]|uniref:low affinity iron permease family protein n=1 Tax=Achromobacter sp. RTa TaxID=1532557 RepID=UPI0009E09AAC|nr:low affinity iron permease family protein [Achromobacter sp. RTa]
MDASRARRNGSPRSPGKSVATYFDHFAAAVTAWAGSSIAFGLAVGVVAAWALTGPVSGYSESWQLVINTGTTIVTFLMVFLIQQSQNKNDRALHLKIDDLLIALKDADEDLVDAERLDEDRLVALAAALTAHAKRMARDKRRRLADERKGRAPEGGGREAMKTARRRRVAGRGPAGRRQAAGLSGARSGLKPKGLA